MRNNTHLRLTADSPVPSTILTDTSGSPRESYDWRHMAAVQREWLHEFWRPHVNASEPTTAEIISIERRVRKELYPERVIRRFPGIESQSATIKKKS